LFTEIESAALEKACIEIIETILFCLPDTFKGTIYRIGNPPDLIAEKIASGIIDDRREKISWGLPAESGYDPPGKPWTDYRDEPGRPLEAMCWCVERQKSWTVEDPYSDTRSIGLQVEGRPDGCHHMEPVLVRKADLKLEGQASFKYPCDFEENVIWKDSDYVVVAVIKIHFHQGSLKLGGYEAKVIKKLSRALGTELLSYKLHKDSMKAMERLARERLHACNVLADSLRNATTKSGLIFSLVKQEIGYLRDQWEQVLREARKDRNGKVEAIRELNRLLRNINGACEPLREDLVAVQNKFLDFSLPPEKGENWVNMQIVTRWKNLLGKCPQERHTAEMVWKTVDTLKKTLHYGHDHDSIAVYDRIPDDTKTEWVNLLYSNNDHFDELALGRLISILNNPDLEIPSRERSRKTLVQLKALAETIRKLEENTNFVLGQVLNGVDKGKASAILQNTEVNSSPR
jgi:signal recognition particle subunit SEC65